MQGVILAIAKARQTFDRDGSEAGLVKVSDLFAKSNSMDICFHRLENLCYIDVSRLRREQSVQFFF